jgi:hypothetical protein
MKVYKGYRTSSGPVIIKSTEGKTGQEVEALKHVVLHSPTGMEWGYGGSGPADLALSILTDLLGGPMARRYYQQFKFDFVAGFKDNWTISADEIRKWLATKNNPL